MRHTHTNGPTFRYSVYVNCVQMTKTNKKIEIFHFKYEYALRQAQLLVGVCCCVGIYGISAAFKSIARTNCVRIHCCCCCC